MTNMLCLGELSLQHKAAQEQHFHGSVMKSQPPSSIQQCWPQPVKIRRPREKRYNSLEKKLQILQQHRMILVLVGRCIHNFTF